MPTLIELSPETRGDVPAGVQIVPVTKEDVGNHEFFFSPITEKWRLVEGFRNYLIVGSQFAREATKGEIENWVVSRAQEVLDELAAVAPDFVGKFLASLQSEIDATREASPPVGRPADLSEDIQWLPHDGPRVETGPIQFGDDWPGVFIRGDNAGWSAFQLSTVLEDTSYDMDITARLQLQSLLGLLRGCVIGPAKDLIPTATSVGRDELVGVLVAACEEALTCIATTTPMGSDKIDDPAVRTAVEAQCEYMDRVRKTLRAALAAAGKGE